MERNRIDENKKRKPTGAAIIQTSLTVALYRAFFQEWACEGYNGIRLERVASRAGAGKAAIYRRWASKKEFAVDAISQIGMTLATMDDHGSLEKDVFAFLLKLRATLRHPLVRRILPDMHAEQARNGDLTEALSILAKKRRAVGAAIFERAISRGEVSPQTNIDFGMSLLPATLYWQIVVLGQRVNRQALQIHATVITHALLWDSQRSAGNP